MLAHAPGGFTAGEGVLQAQVVSLQQELELRKETLRAQADELDALRRELRTKDGEM